MSRKKILIASHALTIGGAERSLLDLLYSLDYERVEVDLFLYRHTGEWMSEIPPQVNLLPCIAEYECLAVPMTDVLKKGKAFVLGGRLLGKWKASVYDKKYNLKDSAVGLEYSHKYTVKFMPPISQKKEYDLAISFLTPHYFVAEKVSAKVKIAWIHTDYSAIAIHKESELCMWNRYDYIASISEKCTESFVKIFPELSKKIILVENVLAEDLVRKKAKQDVSSEIPARENGVNALSIGRFSYAKNFDQVPEICSRIRKKGVDLYWYIIGYGDDREILDNIQKFHMEEYVQLLGRKSNPYPYISACDVYIQPSRYEGKSVTVREAQMLNKPVIITNYSTAGSQLIDGFDGIIVPMDTKECSDQISELLVNKEKLSHVVEGTVKTDYTNKQNLAILYSIMEKSSDCN